MKITNDSKIWDVIIIGAGPSGLTCAIYASRANLDVLFIEKSAPGGKMVSTFNIENWSGDQKIKGVELAQKMLNHAKSTGASYKYGNVAKIEPIHEYLHNVILESNEILQAKAVVIASGMEEKKPTEIENYFKFENKGVSYCVTCDASLYKNKPAAIIGGGDSAFEESIYLSQIASEVNIFVRKDKPRAEAGLVKRVESIPNIKIHYESKIISLIGEQQLEEVEYIQKDQKHKMKINHLYPYIGFKPIIEFAKDLDIFDENSFVITDETMETKIKGLFAIGDIRQKHVRQIVTAASDGAIAGKNLANKLRF